VIFRGPDSFEYSVCRSDVMTRFRPQVHLQKMILMVPLTISANLSIEFPNTLYAVSCKAKSTLPTGGVVAGGLRLPPAPRARARACVCVHIHLWYFFNCINCIKFYINLNCLPFFYLPLIYLFLRVSSTCEFDRHF